MTSTILAQTTITVNHFFQVRPYATFSDAGTPTTDGYFVEEVDNARRILRAYAWQNGRRYSSPLAALSAARQLAHDRGLPVVAPISLRNAYYAQAVA